MDVIVTRVVTLLLLFFGTFGFGILPIFVKRKMKPCDCENGHKKSCSARRSNMITSFLIFFGGGVLLATCLLHLLNEAREGFEKDDHDTKDSNNSAMSTTVSESTTEFLSSTESFESKKEKGEHETFPLPEFIACLGFFAVYLIEEILHATLGHSHAAVPTENDVVRKHTTSFSCSTDCAKSNDCVHVTYYRQRASIIGESFSDKSFKNLPPEFTVLKSEEAKVKFTLSGLFTVAALSFHSLFEGLAVGLQSDDKKTWTMFFAISVHKFVIAFVVGLEVLAEGGKESIVLIYMIIFSAMSPIGSLAAILTEVGMSSSSKIVVGVLNAFATGTLLYVTFFEILQRDKKCQLSGLMQLLATFIGFGFMALIQYLSTFA